MIKRMRKNREKTQIREVVFSSGYTKFSVICSYGNTTVLCSASYEDAVPRFLRDKRQGWLTAEYSMLPTATSKRSPREGETDYQVEHKRFKGY